MALAPYLIRKSSDGGRSEYHSPSPSNVVPKCRCHAFADAANDGNVVSYIDIRESGEEGTMNAKNDDDLCE